MGQARHIEKYMNKVVCKHDYIARIMKRLKNLYWVTFLTAIIPQFEQIYTQIFSDKHTLTSNNSAKPQIPTWSMLSVF